MFLSDVSIKRPVFATMMMVAFVVLGLFSYKRLAVDQFPDIAFPVVVVQTEYPGASPEIIESDVTRKMLAMTAVLGAAFLILPHGIGWFGFVDGRVASDAPNPHPTVAAPASLNAIETI